MWEMCGDQLIKNLLDKNDNKVMYLEKSDCGDIEFNGCKFKERYMIDDNT